MIMDMSRDYRNTVGKRIKLLRQDLGIQQKDLAELIEIGQSHLSQIERGEKRPTAAVLVKIAKALGTTADYLLMMENEETREPEPEAIGVSTEAEEVARLVDSAKNTYTRQLCVALVQAAVAHEQAALVADQARLAELQKVAGLLAQGSGQNVDEVIQSVQAALLDFAQTRTFYAPTK